MATFSKLHRFVGPTRVNGCSNRRQIAPRLGGRKCLQLCLIRIPFSQDASKCDRQSETVPPANSGLIARRRHVSGSGSVLSTRGAGRSRGQSSLVFLSDFLEAGCLTDEKTASISPVDGCLTLSLSEIDGCFTVLVSYSFNSTSSSQASSN